MKLITTPPNISQVANEMKKFPPFMSYMQAYQESESFLRLLAAENSEEKMRLIMECAASAFKAGQIVGLK